MPIELEGLILYTVEELAGILNMNENTIRQYLREGKLQGKKLGKKWFITSDDIKGYFKDSAESNSVEEKN